MFIVVWSGGLEPPCIAARATFDEVFEEFYRPWQQNMDDGDYLDIFEIECDSDVFRVVSRTPEEV